MTMGEGKWKHLHEILKKTDNGDTLPSNRSFHTYHHYTYKLQSLHQYLWKNKILSGFGKWNHHFEHDEFQNRGAIHTHGVAWLKKLISELISYNIIRADLSDPITESKLYHLVKTHQIHHCIPSKCGGPCSDGKQCNQNFPKPLSNITYYNEELGIFIYRRTKSEDQWIVTYNAPTLLLWEAHHNFQYVSDKHFAKYICKYVTKPEPSDLFNIQESDAYRRHIHARRLGTLELMLLLLEKKVSRCSIAVDFLPSSPPGYRTRAIKPIWMLNEQNNIDPYYEDAIDKYFERPNNPEFNDITYPEYYRKYKITLNSPSKQIYWKDKSDRFVFKRKKEILVRFQHLTIKNAELFFYQQLLLKKPSRTETDLKNNHLTYRAAFQSFYPNEYNNAIQDIFQSTTLKKSLYLENYKNLIDNLLISTHQDIKIIIKQQLINLIPQTISISNNTILNTPKDQYIAYNILTACWGPIYEQKKHSCFFLTGSAGNRKTFLTKQIINYLKLNNKKYIVMALTGIAA